MTIAQQVGRIGAGLETAGRSREFAMLAMALMQTKGDRERALGRADVNNLPQRVREVLKSSPAVPVPGGTIDGWSAVAPYQVLAQGFAGTLASFAAFDSVLADAVVVPLHSQFAIITTDTSAAAVGAGSAKPVASATSYASAMLRLRSVDRRGGDNRRRGVTNRGRSDRPSTVDCFAKRRAGCRSARTTRWLAVSVLQKLRATAKCLHKLFAQPFF